MTMTGRAVTAQFMPSRPDLEKQIIEQGKKEGRMWEQKERFPGLSVHWLREISMLPMPIVNQIWVQLLVLTLEWCLFPVKKRRCLLWTCA